MLVLLLLIVPVCCELSTFGRIAASNRRRRFTGAKDHDGGELWRLACRRCLNLGICRQGTGDNGAVRTCGAVAVCRHLLCFPVVFLFLVCRRRENDPLWDPNCGVNAPINLFSEYRIDILPLGQPGGGVDQEIKIWSCLFGLFWGSFSPRQQPRGSKSQFFQRRDPVNTGTKVGLPSCFRTPICFLA